MKPRPSRPASPWHRPPGQLPAGCTVSRLCALAWAFGLCLLLALPSVTQAQPPGTLRLAHAKVAYSNGQTPPESGWTPVVLPEHFVLNPEPDTRTGWYRLAFDLAAPPDKPLVLLVQRVVMTAEFRLNGSLLNPGVRFEQPGGLVATPMLNRPHWIVLPAGLFKSGRNELEIRLQGDRVTPPWVSGISIGPPEALRGEFLLRDIPQRLIPQALLVLILASLVFGVRLWWIERQRWQAQVIVTMLLWAASLGTYLVDAVPLSWSAAATLIGIMWIAFHWALLHLLWQLSDGGWPWFPRVLAIGSAVPLVGMGLVLALEPSGAVLGLLMLPTTVLRCMTTVLLIGWAWRERSWRAVLLTASELLWFAGPVQLLLVVLDVIPPDPFMVQPGGALPLYLVVVWLVAQRMAQQREQAALDRQAAVLEERQRMMLDMHDGVGSQLVTALRLARRDDVPRAEVAHAVQDALHDLRLIIDAPDGAAQELQVLLQQWRQRHQARLATAGPRLDWDLAALPAPRPLSAPEALQILRILQEAVNNAIQHAASTTVRIALAPVPGGCELRVSDDGAGFANTNAAPMHRGRGLDNMRQRASRLGARLDVRPGEHRGTVVTLRLPDAAPT